MSMSQLKTPDEEWDEIWQNVRWYHLPLVLLVFFVVPAFVVLSCATVSLFRKGKK